MEEAGESRGPKQKSFSIVEENEENEEKMPPLVLASKNSIQRRRPTAVYRCCPI